MPSAGRACAGPWQAHPSPARSSTRSPHRASTSSRRSSAARHRQGPSSTAMTPSREPGRTPRAAPPPSPSCASRTGSVDPWTTSAPSVPPSRSRSSRRSSSSTPGSSTSSGLPGPTSCCCSRSCIPRNAWHGSWRRRGTSAWNRSWRRTTLARSSSRSLAGRGSSGSTTGTSGRWTWIPSVPCACATSSRTTASPLPSRASATRRPSPAGVRAATTGRLSVRR